MFTPQGEKVLPVEMDDSPTPHPSLAAGSVGLFPFCCSTAIQLGADTQPQPARGFLLLCVGLSSGQSPTHQLLPCCSFFTAVLGKQARYMLCPHSIDGETETASNDMDTGTAGLRIGSIDLLPGPHETLLSSEHVRERQGDTIRW